MERALVLTSVALLLGLPCSSTFAAEPAAPPSSDGEAASVGPAREGDASPGPAPAASTADVQPPRPWLQRWAPERTMIEVGLYGGVLLPSRRAELFEADLALPDQGYRPLAPAAPDLGVRVGSYARPWFGVEAEGGVMPTRAEPRGRALLWTARGSFVAQLGLWSVTPFVLLGGGLLGVSSSPDVVGNDVDAALHVGGGVKVFLHSHAALRLDVRDVITARRGYKEGLSNNPEIVLGMTITLGRRSARPPKRAPQPAPASGSPDPSEHPPTDPDGPGADPVEEPINE